VAKTSTNRLPKPGEQPSQDADRVPTEARQGRLALAPGLLRVLPGLLALLLFLALLAGPDLLGAGARPLQALLALALAGSVAARANLPLRLRALERATALHYGLLGAVAVLALVLRVWGYRFGLPYFEHADEWAVADKALAILQTGDFNPRRFIYPNLYIYLQTGVALLHFLWGASVGLYKDLGDIDRAAFYAWGRLLTAALGAGTVLATYATARLLYDRSVGLVAAALLAVFPAHVADSHYVTTDTPASFFTMLAFVGIAALATRPPATRVNRLAAATLCGLAVGLATATKYNVALLVLPLLLALVWAEPNDQDAASRVARVGASALYALAGVALGFTLGTPFWIAELPLLLNELASILDHYKFKGHPGHESERPWLDYALAYYREGQLAALLAALGLGLAFLRHRRADILLLLFVVPSFLQLAGLKVIFFRNLMPLLPFGCIFAALGASALAAWLASRRRWRGGSRLLLAALTLLALVSPLTASVRADLRLARPTTRLLATEWVVANAPAGARVWLEDQTLILPADRFRVAGGRPVLEQPLEWYREQGYRLLVASISGYSNEERAQLEALAQQGAGAQRFDGAGERAGPALLVIDTGLAAAEDEPHTPLGASLAGDALLLEGYRHPGAVAAGETLPLALFWRAQRPLDGDYTVFVHLLDDQGNKLAQRDLPPLEGSLPTSQWRAGELIRDDQDLLIPANVPPGSYQLSVGMYRADTMQQLNAGPILIGPVTVSER
jgi:4-amino-4-deoxy-L-arabinose transferase-like glycosyltransferase